MQATNQHTFSNHIDTDYIEVDCRHWLEHNSVAEGNVHVASEVI